jgi:hypothetical protein
MKTIVIAILCLIVIALSVLAFSFHARRMKLATTFASVQIGDTKQTIVQLLGNPDEITVCRERDSAKRGYVDSAQECVEVYWYISFLEEWGFFLNRDGKVIDKGHDVSF